VVPQEASVNASGDECTRNKLILRAEAYAVIGAAIEVLNDLGHGLHEKPYENALAVELGLRGIACQQQTRFDVVYKGIETPVGADRPHRFRNHELTRRNILWVHSRFRTYSSGPASFASASEDAHPYRFLDHNLISNVRYSRFYEPNPRDGHRRFHTR
jgi:hypothetical protein